MAEDGTHPTKRQRTVLHTADGFQKSATPKIPNPSFKSAFDSESSIFPPLHRPHTAKFSALTSMSKPVVIAPSQPRLDLTPTSKPTSILVPPRLRLPHNSSKPSGVPHPAPCLDVAPKKPMSVIKHPPPFPQPPLQVNVTPRKHVSEIKHPLPSLRKPGSRRGVKTISTTSIATAMDLDTEDGNMELSSLLLQQHYGANATLAPSSNQISRGLEISPQKSSGSSRAIAGKFVRGGLADQANVFFSRSKTAETLWNRQVQSSNQKIQPDMRLSVLDVLNSSSRRAMLVKCFVPTENRETLVLLFRSMYDVQLRKGQEIHVWRPWTVVSDVVLCTRFVVGT